MEKEKYLYYFAQSSKEQDIIDEIVEKYPFKITPYLAKLMQNSEAIRKQYLPHPHEVIIQGTTDQPFEEGKNATSNYGLERVYRDRVLVTPHFDCFAYCRFCYKKSRVMRSKREMTDEQINEAIVKIAEMDNVRGVLITGGDPLKNPEKLFYTLDKLIALDNIFEIRIGTRALLVNPQIFTDELCDHLASYIRFEINNRAKSKSLAINVHFNHPDELSMEVLQSCHKLVSRGIILRNQTVLLKGINDDKNVLQDLFKLLLRNRIIPYYFNHCMPVEGSTHLRCSLQKGLDIYQHLCTESATAIPHYVYAPQAGKIHVGPDTKFNYVVKDGMRYIEAKTMYKRAEFLTLTNKKQLPPNHWVDEDDHIVGLYLDGND